MGFEGARNYGEAFGAFQSHDNDKVYHCPNALRDYIYYEQEIKIEDEFEQLWGYFIMDLPEINAKI